jgi:catechol 2,3-dioxygenase-like lactoylglutathione lyase family enzyme
MFADELILGVDDLAASTQFYRALLGREALLRQRGETSFALNASTRLTLRAGAAATEIGLRLADLSAVDAEHLGWLDEGFRVLQPPSRSAGRYAACTADPDGRRLRLYVPLLPWPSL